MRVSARILYLLLGLYLLPLGPVVLIAVDVQRFAELIPFAAALVSAFMSGPVYVVGPLLAPLFARSAQHLKVDLLKATAGRDFYWLISTLSGVFIGSLLVATSLKGHSAVWLSYAHDDGLEGIRDITHLYLSQSITNIALISGIHAWAARE